MNVRIFWVRAMKCMCAQTRSRFILSSERVFWGMEFEPMLTPREKSPLPENVPRGGSNPRCCGQRAQALPTELFQPQTENETACPQVIGVCGGAEKCALLRQRGVAHAIDYRTEKVRERVKEITSGNGVNVVVDQVGGDLFTDCLKRWGCHT